MKSRKVAIVLHRDGDTKPRSVSMPMWVARALAITGGVVGFLIVLGAALYVPVIRTAARVPGLQREVNELRAENQQVHQLSRTLSDLEARYAQVRGMLGGNLVPPPRSEGVDRLPFAHAIVAAAPDEVRYEEGPSVPTHWPLDVPGIVTREQVGGSGAGDVHPGLDVAVPMLSPIRASGGGEVVETGDDPEYGRFAVINHPSGYSSVYGHAQHMLVRVGDRVSAGQVIGVSGSTGNSTGPHLHFEIRRNGQAVDPRTVLRNTF
ncbi:MAG: M23 family metallopeptidase [Gemmatimonadales bacterium]